MVKHHNPATVAPPFSSYSHGVEVPAGARWLHVSGQIGVRPDGTLAGERRGAAGAGLAQRLRRSRGGRHDQAGPGQDHGLPDRHADTALARGARRMLEGATPASTLIFVTGLARPDFLIEIEAIAAAE